jgi:hypothetical protein
MPVRSLRTLAVVTLVSVLAVPSCGGSGDEGLAGSSDSLLGMLGQVPAMGSMRDQVTYSNLARLREAAGIETPTGDIERYGGELMDAASTGWTVAAPLGTNAFSSDFTTEVGFDLTHVDASIDAGVPPDLLAIFTGRIDDDAVDRALTTFEPFADDLDKGEREGVTTYRFGEDGERNLDNITAARPTGEGLRLGVADGTVLWARSDAVLDDAIDAGRGEGRSLADVDGFRETANALDDAAVHTALMLGDSTGFGLTDLTVLLGEELTPEQIEALEDETADTALARWEVAALGERLVGDSHEMLIVLWHTSEDAAAISAERLKALLLNGESFRTGQPWSTICSDPTVSRDGPLVTAQCTLDVPGRALQIAFARDSLLVWR